MLKTMENDKNVSSKSGLGHFYGQQLNSVGCYMLRPFAHPVACFCVLLGVVLQSFKLINKLLATCKQRKNSQYVGSCRIHLHVALVFPLFFLLKPITAMDTI